MDNYMDVLINKNLEIDELKKEMSDNKRIIGKALTYIFEMLDGNVNNYIRFCYEQLGMDCKQLCDEMADCGLNPDEQNEMLNDLGAIAQSYINKPLIDSIFCLGRKECIEMGILTPQQWEATYKDFIRMITATYGDLWTD